MEKIVLFIFMFAVFEFQSVKTQAFIEDNKPARLSKKTEPIKQYDLNPHYFFFRGKPVTLMTVGEHYSSLVNRLYDYETYFTELQSYGLNQTRIFSGSYVGPSDKGSPLQLEGKHVFIAPWAWSKEKGGRYGHKFDLETWNPEYFKRLKQVLTSAGKHGVVVEMVLFCAYYEDGDWAASPFNPANNIQGIAKLDHAHKALTLANSVLTNYQKKLVRKIITECRGYDNVYFEIANEPYWSHRGGVTPEERGAWHNAMIAEAVNAESRLPLNKRHMIAVNDGHPSIDLKDISVINFHYVATGGFTGGIKGVKQYYNSGKALMIDETEFAGTRRVPQYNAADARVEAWEFMVGGGGGYGNLALTTYNVKNPAGKSAHTDSLKLEISNLKKFIEGLNLAETFRDTTVLAGGIPENIHASALCSEKKKFILYFHSGTLIKQPAYTTFTGVVTLSPTLELPSGKYSVSWMNPYDLNVLKTGEIVSVTENIILNSPEFSIDIALVISKIEN